MNVDIEPSDYKILIVDDILSNVLLLKALLKNEKYRTVTAGNGTEALKAVEQEPVDLILLDVMMPDISGFDVAKQLKSDPRYKDIPIIFLTALNSTADIVKGFQSGGSDFISKPFNKEELIIRISHQISLIAAKNIILRQTEELISTIKGRDKLYSVIAHDLRGPMGSIKMMLNMLLLSTDSKSIGEDSFEMLGMANQTTEEVFALLDNLLKWTKSQLGRLNVAYQDFNAVDIAQSVIEVFASVAALKKINIRTDFPAATEVHADTDMVKTVIRNLLSNAIKFSNEGGNIDVSVQEKDDFAVISIRDYGRGIKEEDQGKLLHSDTHFSTFGTKNEEGSGLGLLLCQDFAVKNGGKLWFVSEERMGSTFSFSIPKKQQ